MTEAAPSTTLPVKVPAWDLPTRIFKWALVALVASAWISDEFGGTTPAWHVINGQLVLVAVVFRLLWGLVGGSTARFASFLYGPAATIRYGLDLLRGREAHYLGHNPLGGWMVIALVGLCGVLAVSGLFNADSDRLVIEGPLSAPLSDAWVWRAHRLHAFAFDLLKIAVVLHLGAVIWHSVVKKDRIVPAMATGLKPAGDYADAPRATYGNVALALGCLAVSAVAVFGGIALLR